MATMRITKYEIEHEVLPQVCVLTGEPTSYKHSVRFVWLPPGLARFFIFGLVGYGIAMMTHKQEMWVRLPIVRRKRWHWARKQACAPIAGIACLIAIIYGFANSNAVNPFPEYPDYGRIACIAGLVGLVAAGILERHLHRTGIYACEITDRDIELTGLHESFVEAMGIERIGEEARELVRRVALEKWQEERDAADSVGWGTGHPRARRVPTGGSSNSDADAQAWLQSAEEELKANPPKPEESHPGPADLDAST